MQIWLMESEPIGLPIGFSGNSCRSLHTIKEAINEMLEFFYALIRKRFKGLHGLIKSCWSK